MSGLIAMMKKEIRSVSREKTIILAIIIQLMLATLSSMILTGIISYYDPNFGQDGSFKIKIGVAGDINDSLLNILRNDKTFLVKTYDSFESAENAYENGQVDAVLILPAQSGDTREAALYLPPSQSRSSVILMMLKEPLKQYEDLLRMKSGIRVNNLAMEGKPNVVYEFMYTLIIPMLMLFPAFIAGGMVIDSLSEEFESAMMPTLLSTPVTVNVMLASKALSAILIAMAQCILWAVLLGINGYPAYRFFELMLLILLMTCIITAGAAAIVTIFKDRERSQFTYAISLVGVIALAYFLSPSPFNLIARLAMGDSFVGIQDIAVYGVLFILIVIPYYYLLPKLMEVKM